MSRQTLDELPFEYPAEVWSADENTPFSLATQGVPCEAATVAAALFLPTAGTFTTYTIVPEIWRPNSGWIVLADEALTINANTGGELRIDVSDAFRFGFRVNASAGGTGGNKFISLA